MSVHKDKKSNTWYVKYQNHTKRGFRYKKDAVAYEAQMLLEPVVESEVITFHSLAEEYLHFKKTDVQYTTYLKYKEGIEIVMKNYFPNKPIDKITITDCDLFKEIVGDLDYSSSYKNKLMTQFKAIFNYAIRRGYINSNPASLIKGYKKTVDELGRERKREDNVWTYEEFNHFLSYVDDEECKLLFITLFTTGMRLGECLALTWNDFSGSSLSITKSHTKQTEKGSFEIKIPKNNSSIRVVSITPSLNEMLLKKKKSSQNNNPDFSEKDFIFGGKKPLARTTVERKKNLAVAASGVKKIRIHDFRHSHATILINNGMNIVSVSRRLGHSDINMTLKTYTHLLEKQDEKMIAFLEESSHKSSQFKACN